MTASGILPAGSIFQEGYEVLTELGSGSFGRVYKARQLSTGQQVAIKVLRFREHDSRADVDNQIERFRRETRLCAELSHPNIVRLIDSGQTGDGLLYGIFEYVPGATLKDVLAEEGHLGWTETAHLMTQVLDALACAHARGVVHRDLKPENIMVTKTGVRRNALVLDFGLGGFSRDAAEWALPRLTATREVMGTPCYAAPEQLRGETPSPRSDIYSWALVFLECLTGEMAVNGASAQEIVAKQLGPEPIRIAPSVRDRRLRQLLQTATAKRVEKRHVTIDDLVRALAGTEPERDGTGTADVPEGERRQLTIVACGMTVTSKGLPLDIEELDQLLHAQHARFGKVAREAGAYVSAVAGGSMLLAFGYPQAREDDARRAVRTALRILAEAEHASERLAAEGGLGLEVRIGIHTGLVIVRERSGRHGQPLDLVGVTSQVATRLQELARPGEILAGHDTQRLLRETVRCEPLGERRLPELSHALPVFRVVGEPARRLATISFVGETPLVGRRDELGRLVAAWNGAQAGRGGALVITGEPGIGKSRLVRELRRRVPGEAWLEVRCVPENRDSPLRPIADMMAAIGEPLESILERRGFDVANTYPPLAAALSHALDDRWPRPKLTPERAKEVALDTIIRLLFRMAAERPTAIAFEDVHWADPTTVEVISLLVREIAASAVGDAPPILFVATARAEFRPPWPISEVTPLPLSRLGPDEVEAMVNAGVANGRTLPRPILDQVIRRADGVPLFIEEVTRVLMETPARDTDARGRNVVIPSTLRDLLAARLDAITPRARGTAQLASVLGREFRADVLRRASKRSDEVMRENLGELVDAGIIHQRRSALGESYVFKHALVRDAAYESMMLPARQRLHLRVATALREHFPEVERQPEVLALHFEHGHDLETAVGYWKRAGDATMGRGAYVEAIRVFERGLALLEQLPESRQRMQHELGLTESLGTALFLTRGQGAPEVAEKFASALRLCEALGIEDVPLRVLAGIWNNQIVRSNRQTTATLLDNMRRRAERFRDPVTMLTRHGWAGARAFYVGDFLESRDEMTRATEWYQTDDYRTFVKQYGYDGGIATYGILLWTSWILGYPDRARETCEEMLAVAERMGSPSSVAWALGYAANLAREHRELDRIYELTTRSLVQANEQKLFFWLGPALCTQGWANAQQGNVEEAIAKIRQGLAVYQACGAEGTYDYHRSALIAALLVGRQAEEALPLVRDGLGRCQRLLDCFHEAELRRLEGEALHMLGDEDGAEASFRAAIDVASRQGAKSYELRAAMSRARLLRERGKPAAARDALAPVFGWFTEGHDTHDIREAAALLAELA